MNLGPAQVREEALDGWHLHDGCPGPQHRLLVPAVWVHVARRVYEGWVSRNAIIDAEEQSISKDNSTLETSYIFSDVFSIPPFDTNGP